MSFKNKNEVLKRALSEEIYTYLQPVVNIKDEKIEGWEALSRGPRGTVLERADRLFFHARKVGKIRMLEHKCIKNGLSVFNDLRDKKLFINVGSSIFADRLDGLADSFLKRFNNCSLVLEITEHSRVNLDKVVKAAAWYRSRGIAVAIDDVASGYDRLKSILYIKPEYLKIDRDLVDNCDRDKDRRSIINHLFQLGKSLGSQVIAEGVQTSGELQTLREIGIELCQGFIFSRPFPAEELNKKSERDMLQVI